MRAGRLVFGVPGGLLRDASLRDSSHAMRLGARGNEAWMSRVRYAKGEEDLAITNASVQEARDGFAVESSERVRVIRCVYETDAEAVRAIVPKPLELLAQPEVEVRIESRLIPGESDEAVELRTASFSIRIAYDDRPGLYPITTSVSCESAMRIGRERYGEPMKLAAIHYDASSAGVTIEVERRGISFLRATGRPVEELPSCEEDVVSYCFKAFPSCGDAKAFDQDPQLIRVEDGFRFERVFRLEGGLELWESAFDPVADLPIRKQVIFEWAEGVRERHARVLRPVPEEWLLPFFHQRFDEPNILGSEV